MMYLDNDIIECMLKVWFGLRRREIT